MAKHHEEHPDYSEMGIFAGYGEYDTPIKDGYSRTDEDGLYYRTEDTKWGIWPDHETGDPGWLVAKAGATPVSYDEAH